MEDSSSSSSPSASLDLSSDLRFRAYAALVALAVVALLAVCFWRLYRLTVSARPQDMMPVSSSCARACKVALPAFVHGGAAVECAVCLADLRDGERGRLLPGCGHRFHVECIDRWFRANSTCPICRATVGEPGAVEAHKGTAVVVVQA